MDSYSIRHLLRCSSDELTELKEAFRLQLETLLVSDQPFSCRSSDEIDGNGSIQDRIWATVMMSDPRFTEMLQGHRWLSHGQRPYNLEDHLFKTKRQICIDIVREGSTVRSEPWSEHHNRKMNSDFEVGDDGSLNRVGNLHTQRARASSHQRRTQATSDESSIVLIPRLTEQSPVRAKKRRRLDAEREQDDAANIYEGWSENGKQSQVHGEQLRKMHAPSHTPKPNKRQLSIRQEVGERLTAIAPLPKKGCSATRLRLSKPPSKPASQSHIAYDTEEGSAPQASDRSCDSDYAATSSSTASTTSTSHASSSSHCAESILEPVAAPSLADRVKGMVRRQVKAAETRLLASVDRRLTDHTERIQVALQAGQGEQNEGGADGEPGRTGAARQMHSRSLRERQVVSYRDPSWKQFLAGEEGRGKLLFTAGVVRAYAGVIE